MGNAKSINLFIAYIERRKTIKILFSIIILAMLIALTSCTDNPQKVIQKAKKSVVTIKTSTGSGSGVIISPDGLIVTNNHVVGNDETVEVHFQDGKTTIASPIKKGLSVLDVAYLKVDGSNFDYLPMNDQCSAGDEVYAIGAPLGLSESVSKGIISNCDRTIKGVKFIQTDAAINAGNSGGPLINKKGEVLGLLTFKIAAAGIEGMNFAISQTVVRDYYENKLTNLEEALKRDLPEQTFPKAVGWQYLQSGSFSKDNIQTDFDTYYDADSVMVQNENTFRVWMKDIRSSNPGKGTVFTRELVEINCQNRMVRAIDWTCYMITGEVYATQQDSPNWLNIRPDSAKDKLLKIYCKRR